jgi:hypothetical protein
MCHCVTFSQKKKEKRVWDLLIFVPIPTQVMHGVWKVDQYFIWCSHLWTLDNFVVSHLLMYLIMQDLKQVLESMATSRKGLDDYGALFNFQKSSRHDEFQATLQDIVKFITCVKLSNSKIDDAVKISNGEIDETIVLT